MFIMKVLVGSIVATTFMTAFSFLWGYITATLTKEPILLNILLRRSNIFSNSISNNSLNGWFLHYFIGLIFILIMYLLWDFDLIKFSLLSASLMGFVAGIIGIRGWQIMFAASRKPPRINYINYYNQLLLAHIIFGITGYMVYPYFA